MDFEEFVTLLGPKLSTSGIPERFHGTDFDTVFWKVCQGRRGPRAVHTVEGCTGTSEWPGLLCEGGMATPAFCPLDVLCPRERVLGSREKLGKDLTSGASGFQPCGIWRPVPAQMAAGAGWGLWG